MDKLLEEHKYLCDELENSYNKYKDVYENGCDDLFWSDGVYLYLLRKSIIVLKQKLKYLLSDGNYHLLPNEYYLPLPKPIPLEFMAMTRYIFSQRTFVLSNKDFFNLPEKYLDFMRCCRDGNGFR